MSDKGLGTWNFSFIVRILLKIFQLWILKCLLNVIDNLDFKNQTPTKDYKKQRVCPEGIGVLCTTRELSCWDPNAYNTDVTDKDSSYILQTRTDCMLFIFLHDEQLDLLVTWIFRAHLHSIQENHILLIVEMPCSGCILNLAADNLQLPSKAVGQYLPWCITHSPLCFTEDGTQI